MIGGLEDSQFVEPELIIRDTIMMAVERTIDNNTRIQCEKEENS